MALLEVVVTNTIDTLKNSKELQAVILASCLAASGFFAKSRLERRGRIWWWQNYNEIFIVPQQEGQALSFYATRYGIRNTGNKEVENLEISLNYQPQHMGIYPHIPWTSSINPDGRQIINFKILNKSEELMLSMLSMGADCPQVTYVRFKGGSGKKIEVMNQRVFHKSIQITSAAIFIFGFLSIIGIVAYVIVNLI